jgi:sugar phosphate isomerase/epimerase
MGTAVESAADIDALMEATGTDVALLLDTGHAAFAGADPATLARRYRARIAHVHAKDLRRAVCERATGEKWSFLQAVLAGVFTVPGDGSVAFAEVFRELGGYSGWVVLEAEQDPRIADPMTYASLGYRNLRQLLEARLQ